MKEMELYCVDMNRSFYKLLKKEYANTYSMSKGNSSSAADAEGASSSTKDEIIRGLNEDLAKKYKSNYPVCRV